MSLTLNIRQEDAEKIASCIKNIAGNVTASDIVEIVLKAPPIPEKVKADKAGITMTSKEVAEVLGKGHSVVFKKIAKFLCTDAKEDEKAEFQLTSFRIPQGIDYPMYEMTERACNLYCEWMKSYKATYKTLAAGLERLKVAIQERFHPERKGSAGIAMGSNFLLEGKPRSEYEAYCDMFDQFITGPGVEGREITELTEKYQRFYDVMKATQLKAKESNALEVALFDVAIDAEMQGFIYGFKLFDALLNRQLEAAI